MPKIWSKLLLCAAFTAAASGLAADDKKAEKKPETKEPKPAAAKAPDFSAYSTAETVTATVVSAGEDGVTVRVSWPALKNPNAIIRRSSKRLPNLKEEHTDIEFKYADGGYTRWKKLPPKIDGDGKKVSYSVKEMEELRKPLGVTGYAADKSEVKAGAIVELHLLRPKEIKAEKATTEDLVIKVALIVGEAEKPPVPDKKEMPAKKPPEKK